MTEKERIQVENKIKEDYFSVQKISLRYAGLSLDGNEFFLYKVYVRIIFCLRIGWFFLLIGEIFVHTREGNLNLVVKAAIFLFGITMETSMALNLFFKRGKLGKACKMLQNGRFVPNLERGGLIEEKWIKDCIESGKWQAYVGGMLGLVAVSLLGIVCYVKKLSTPDPSKWDLPFGRSTIIDVTYSPNYEIVLVWQTCSLYLAALNYITIDLLLSNVLAHLAVQCRILQNFIKLFLERTYQRMSEQDTGSTSVTTPDPTKIPWKYLKQLLVEVVEYHTSIVEICKIFEEIFWPVMLIEHIGVLLVLSCVMYDASLFPITDPRFLPDFAIAIAVLLQVCGVGYWGSEIMYESEQVGRACMETNFVGTDLRFQKAWSLIVARSQRPILFTVGKFANLSVVTSFGMLKAAVSYFMVLKNRNNGE